MIRFLLLAVASAAAAVDLSANNISLTADGTTYLYKPTRVLSEDLDGDGFCDIAGSYNSGTGLVMSNGDGTFTESTLHSTNLAGIFDLDSDGVPDVLCYDSHPDNSPTVDVLLQDAGTRTFSAAAQSFALDLASWSEPGAGDFNADGWLDIVYADSSNTLRYNAGPDWSASTSMGITLSSARQMQVGDFDGDGDADLFAISSSAILVISNDDGGATFTTQRSYTINFGDSGGGGRVGFIDGDEHLDGIMAQYWGDQTTLLFSHLADYDNLEPVVVYDEGGASSNSDWGDVNGDGVPDIVVADAGFGQVVPLSGQPGYRILADDGAGSHARDVTVCDFDGDGDIDIYGAFSTASGRVFWTETVPLPPANITASPRSATQLLVTWSDTATALDYTVTVDPADIADVSTTDTSVLLEGLTNGVSYTVSVHARNEYGFSLSGDAAQAVPWTPVETASHALPSTGDTPTRVVVLDSGDIVLATAVGDTVYRLANDGQGGFSSPVAFFSTGAGVGDPYDMRTDGSTVLVATRAATIVSSAGDVYALPADAVWLRLYSDDVFFAALPGNGSVVRNGVAVVTGVVVDRGFAAADVDGDGAADLLLPTSDGSLRHYRGPDFALLQTIVDVGSDVHTVLVSGGNVYVAAAQGLVLLAVTDGLLDAPQTLEDRWPNATALALVDLDLDGEQDVAFLSGSDATSVAWLDEAVTVGACAAGADNFALADLDADGDVDVACPGLWLEVLTVPPSAPLNVQAAAEITGDVALTWDPPASDNGAAITAYSLPNAVTGLTPGQTYNFAVAATNYRGTGPASAAVSVMSTTPVELGASTAAAADAVAVRVTPDGDIAFVTASACTLGADVLSDALVGAVDLAVRDDGTVAVLGSSTVYLLPGSTTYDFDGGAPVAIAAADVDGDTSQDIVFSTNASLAYISIADDTVTTIDDTLVDAGRFAVTDSGAIAVPTHGDQLRVFRDLALDDTFTVAGTATAALARGDDVLVGSSLVEIDTAAVVDTAAAATLLATGDLNRDGELDLITAAGWLPGPDFVDAIDLDLGQPAAAAVGDFDADGDLDILTPGAWLEVLTVPSEPLNLQASVDIAGDVTLTWDPPASDNGAAVTAYSLPNTVTGLTPGQTYNFSVAATSYRGTGPASAVVFVTPTTAVEIGEATTVAVGADVVRAGDVDDDGVADLVGITGATQLAWFNWAATVLSDSLVGAADLAVADVDGDGWLDILVLGSEAVYIFATEGRGAAAFGADATEIAIPGPAFQPVAIEAADVDGDGAQDIVFSTNASLAYISTAGDDTVTTIDDTLVDAGRFAVVDLDADGELDLVIPHADGELRVYRDLQLTQTRTLPDAAQLVVAGDVSGDGFPDVVTGASKLLNDGTGVLYPAVAIAAALSGTASAALVDLDLDGELDLVGSTSADVVWLPGSADLDEPITLAPGSAAVVADFDADGDVDIAFPGAWLEVLTAPIPPEVFVEADRQGGALVVTYGDIDDNGAPVLDVTTFVDGEAVESADGLTNGQTYAISLSVTNYRGTSTTEPVYATPFQRVGGIVTAITTTALTSPTYALAGDFDGDGLGDAVACDGAVAWFELAADVEHVVATDNTLVAVLHDEIFTAPQDDWTAMGVGNMGIVLARSGEMLWGDNNTRELENKGVESIAVGDIDGDGFDDVVVPYDGSRSAYVYQGPNMTYAYSIGGLFYPYGATLGDIDGDGDLDAVFSSESGYIWHSENVDGLLTWGSTEIVKDPVVGDPRQLALADVDMDGDVDILFADSSMHMVAYLEQTAAWVFDPEPLVLVSGVSSAKGVAATDMDGDGDVDVVAAWSGGVALLEVHSVPFAPTNLSVNGSVLQWTPPSDNGAAITSYEVSPGNWTATAGAQLDLSGLLTSGFVSVRAVNYRGAGAWSDSVQYDSCSDGVVSGDESDVDCGGAWCAVCEPDERCNSDADCSNAECDADTGRCASCSDGVRNQDETSVDCGGVLACAPCLTSCVGFDYGVYVAWDAVETTDEYLVNGEPLDALDLTLSDLPNYVEVNVTVQGAGPVAAVCFATPAPPTQVASAASALGALLPDGAPALGDLNGDGELDLVIGTADATYVYHGPGPNYTAVATLADVAGTPALGDLTGDGVLDLVMGPDLSLYVGPDFAPAGVAAANYTGNPAVSADGALFVALAGSGVIVPDDYFGSASFGTDVALAICDVDGDGDDVGDAVIVDQATGAAWIVTNGVAQPWAVNATGAPSCAAAEGIALGTEEWWPLVAHPEPPTALAASPVSPTAVELTWGAPEHDGGAEVTGFVVDGVSTTAHTMVRGGLEAGVELEFEAAAANEAGLSGAASVRYTQPQLRAWVNASGPGAFNVSWAIDAPWDTAEVRASAGGLRSSTGVFTGLDCLDYAFNVTVAAADSGDNATVSVQAGAPHGVCPHVCGSSGTRWIDPSQADPFPATCVDGNWTVLTGLTPERQALLLSLSSETRDNGTMVRTSLDSAIETAPAEYWPSVVHLPFNVSLASNTPAATLEVQLDGDGEWRAWPVLETLADEGVWHVLQARAVLGDWAADATPAETTWVYDATPPVALFPDTPAAYSNDRTPTFTLGADEGGVTFSYCAVDECGAFTDSAAGGPEPSTELVGVANETVVVSSSDPEATFGVLFDWAAQWTSSSSPAISVAALDDGWHALLIRAVDAAGTVDSTPVALAAFVGDGDDVPPDTLVLAAPDELVVSGATATVALGASEEGCVFEISLDLGSTWSAAEDVVELAELEDGLYRLLARAIDAQGNTDPVGVAVAWQVGPAPLPDTLFAAAPPAVVAVGASASLQVAADSLVACTFEASFDAGQSWAPVDGDSVPLPTEADGWVAVAVRAVDAAGAVDPTPASAVVRVKPAPVATLAVTPPALSSYAMAVFVVEVADGSDCSVAYDLDDGAETGAASGGSFALGPLGLGAHVVVVQATCDLPAAELEFAWEIEPEESVAAFSLADVGEGGQSAWVYGTDRAGNVGPTAFFNWTVDLSPPDTWLAAEVPAVVTTSSVELVPQCDEAPHCDFVVSEGWFELETGVVHNLTEGRHANLTVAATDRAGNVDPSPVTVDVTVDTTPPELELRLVSAPVTQLPVLVWVSCVDDSGCFDLTLGPGLVAVDGLADGPHNVTVSAVDYVGNAAVASVSAVVDTTAPQTVFPGAADVYANATELALANVSCADATSACAVNTTLDGALVAALNDVPEGAHAVELFAVDAAHNADPTPVAFSLTVDLTPPALSVLNVTYNARGDEAALAVACDEPCRLRGDQFVAWPEPTGTFEARVDAVDRAGNVGAAVVEQLVFDTVPPVVAVTAAPPAYTAEPTGTVEFSVDEANLVACTCNGGACDADGQHSVTAGAADGELSVVIECVDVRGHAGSANASWVVDREAPVTTMLWDPVAINYRSWAVEFSVADASPWTAECWMGDDVAVACTSPWAAAAIADDGETVAVNVTATDAAGNRGAAAGVRVRLDLTPPELLVTTAPLAYTTDEALFVFGCVLQEDCDADLETDPDCSFRYSLDGGAPGDATSPLELSALAPGDYKVEIVATDAAGNTDAEAIAWTLAEQAVVPRLLSGPAASTPLATASFTWNATAEDGVYFVYELDSSGVKEPVPAGALSVSLSGLADGQHLFSVAAAASLDVADAWAWTVEHCGNYGFVESSEAATGALVCEACPAGATCYNGVAHIDDGFWWSRGADAEVGADAVLYPCRVVDACRAAASNRSDICEPGYQGVLCDACAEGYGKTLEMTCAECGSQDNAAFVALAAVLFCVCIATVSLYMVRQSLSAGKAETLRAVSTLKIMANYFLMMGILKDLDLDWGGMVRKLFSWMGVLSGSGASDLQLVNCVARVDTFDQFRLYFVVPALLVTVPAVLLWGYAGVRRVQHAARGEQVKGSARIWGHSKAFVYRQSVLVLSYFAYPVVVTNSFRVLHCKDIEGESRLVQDFSKLCSGAEYETLFAVGVFFATVVALGVPLGIFYMMWRHHSELREAGKAQTQFYFFFGEFRPEWYWWEMTVMARKVAMAAVSVTLSNHEQNMQVYVGTWLLLFSFTAQVTCLPHKDPVQRRLECAAQGAVLGSLLLGQGLAFEGVTDAQRETFQWCTVLLNSVVMSCMGLVLGHDVWKEARGKMHLVRRRAPTVELTTIEIPRSGSDPRGAATRRYTVNPMLI